MQKFARGLFFRRLRLRARDGRQPANGMGSPTNEPRAGEAASGKLKLFPTDRM
jgi:hypothetical protein